MNCRGPRSASSRATNCATCSPRNKPRSPDNKPQQEVVSNLSSSRPSEARAGTHTPRLIFGHCVGRLLLLTSAGGYGSPLSRGRREEKERGNSRSQEDPMD